MRSATSSKKERPATPFVADFVGVLNAMPIRVDDVQDLVASMRLGDGERVEVPVPMSASAGERLTVVVRPERVRVHRRGDAIDEVGGSRLHGRVALIVYLGTLTQFHIDTSLGARLIAHRLSDEGASEVHEGDEVVLSWNHDDSSILRAEG